MHRFVIIASSLALLAGCNVGSSTYGTGKTQESQLVSDLASVVSFKRQKPKKIDYSERAALVKPGSTAGELPAPIEVNEASAAFPGDGAETAPAAKPRIVRRGEDDGLTAEDRKFMNWKGRNSKAYREWTRKRVEKAKAARAVANNSSGRKYFTEPPVEYRKAYESAPKGDVGRTEESKQFRKKSKGNVFSKLLGRG